jgi:hypothetical protein
MNVPLLLFKLPCIDKNQFAKTNSGYAPLLAIAATNSVQIIGTDAFELRLVKHVDSVGLVSKAQAIIQLNSTNLAREIPQM